MDSTARKKIESQTRKAAEMVHLRVKMAAIGAQEATEYWGGKDDRYFEGFEDGLNACKLHIEDAMQAFVDGDLIEEVIGDA